MEAERISKKVTTSCFFIYTALIVFLFIHCTLSFNIQEIKYGKIFIGPENGSQFGFSVKFHENDQGKWLIVGAPKKLEEKSALQSNETVRRQKDGAVYLCPLQEESKNENSSCSVIKLDTKKQEEVIFSCDFESCSLEQLSSDEFDWTRGKDETDSENTGPSRDHTFENATSDVSGYYMFIEASRIPEKEKVLLSGRSAIIATPTQRGTVGDCLRFWYHMYGQKMESLNVYVINNDTGMMMIWNQNGNHGNRWIEGFVTVISEQSYQILFEGLKKHWTGDIGIDDVKILKGQCPEDIDTTTQSVGATITRNSKTGELLTCAPTWKYNCNGQIHSSGACYLFNKNLSSTTMSILTPCRTQVCSTGQVDLVFLIDGSHSVSDIDFSNIQLWLRNVVSSLPISSTYIQVGVLVYTDTTSVAFYLNEFHKIEDMRKALEAMKFKGGNTQTGKAIDVAREDMFSVERGMRPEAKHVAVVLTDGKSQDDVKNPSKKAKEKGITMFAIGVGNANEAELQAISSDPSKYLFTIKDYSALSEIKKALQDSITGLESKGQTSTSEQGQAGLSATFDDDVAIIGAPGLDYWSGGYISYFPNKNISGVFSRDLTTFQNLLHIEVEIRDSAIYGNHTVPDDPYTIDAVRPVPTSSPIDVANQVTHEDKKNETNRHINESIVTMTKSGSNFSTIFTTSGIVTKSNVLSEPIVSFNRTKRTTTQLDEVIEKLKNESDQISFRHKEKYFSEAISILSRDEDVVKLYTDAYFGYSITTGRFMRHNRVDLAFGSPRSSSFGAVFIVKQSREKELNKEPRLVARFQSKQMGSYFGFSLCAADLNGDGLDELIVGAPLWMGKQQDEGRVFIYVSDFVEASDRIYRREVILFGNNKVDSRFGFSFATPGDLNKDGYDDVIIGAPTNSVTKSGSVYVYYGNRNFGIGDQTFQVISASQRQESLSYFGFSLDASQDIDANGYNDLTIGSPGSDKVMVLLSRPVIHTVVQFYATPSILNFTNLDMNAIDQFMVCNGNESKICATLTACFSASGKSIPKNITLAFELFSDTQFLYGSETRAKIVDSKGEIQLMSNSRLYCKDFVVAIKTPVRFQLTPMVFEIKYGLSQSMPTSEKSAVLDIFDAKPKSTIISFAKACYNLTCFSDLNLSCDIIPDNLLGQSSTIVINYDRTIAISINLTNQIDAAYDVELDLHFVSALYLIQVVPMFSNGKRCFERVTESNWVKQEAAKETVLDDTASNDDPATHHLKLLYKDSVMKKGETCAMKLKLGMLDSFDGGNVNFTFQARSSSIELNPSTSQCKVRTSVNMRTELRLNGGTKDDILTFLKSENKSKITAEDSGPLATHMFYLVNNGPSKIPNASLKVQWPKVISSGHTVLRLLNVRCHPVEACVCHNLGVLIEPNLINGTSIEGGQTSDDVAFGSLVEPNEMKTDRNTSQMFVSVTMNCDRPSEEINCQHLDCNIHNLRPSQTVAIELDFRLWKETFLKGKVWKVSFVSKAKVSTENSPFLVHSKGENNFSLIAQVKTEAINGNFQFPIDDETNRKGTWWVILISVVCGVIFLLLLILLLAQLGFFRSKYKEHMQEELQWTNNYKYTIVKQQKADALNHEEMKADAPKPHLSTFQRNQTTPPVL